MLNLFQHLIYQYDTLNLDPETSSGGRPFLNYDFLRRKNLLL
jgi:hypothetical protein